MNVVFRKVATTWQYLQRCAAGVQADGPHWGYLVALRWHVRPFVRRALQVLGVVTRSARPCAVRLVGYEHPLWLRPGTSDYASYRQIFVDREYADVDDLEDVRVILDCGANAGFASVYFLNRFPRARVIAVEPDAGNLSMCRLNLTPYRDRVELVAGGVWGRRGRLSVVPSAFGAGNAWGIWVRPVQPGDADQSIVDAFDVPALLVKAGAAAVDLLKMDIEGSELSVFSECAGPWLRQVRNLVIELHGENCADVFFRALRGFRYGLGRRGDLTYCLDLVSMEAGADTGCHRRGGRVLVT